MDGRDKQATIIIPMKNVRRIIIEKDAPVKINDLAKVKGDRKKKNFNDWDKYVYTSCILIIYLNYGINNSLFPAAMEDFKYLFRTTLVKINYAETFGVAGYLIGSCCGFFYNYINRQLTFLVMVTIQGFFIAIQPLTQNLGQFYAAYMFWELGGAAFDSGNAVWIIEMWKERAPSVLQLAQMMYGLGTIVGPLIIEPYVLGDMTSDELGDLNSTALLYTNTTKSSLNTTAEDINYSVDRRSNLTVPYLLGGGSTMTLPIVLLVMFFVKRYKIPENDENSIKGSAEDNPKGQPSEQTTFTRVVLISLMALLLMSYNGLELTFMTYSSTFYQCLPIKISAPKAAQLMSIFSATYTLGRLLSAFISSKLKAEILIIYHMLIIMISMAVLYFWQSSELAIHLGMGGIGFGFSAMWPSFFAFAENHIKLTDKITSIFAFVSTLMFLVAPFIISPMIESYPEIFLYVIFAYFSAVIVLFITIMVIIRLFKSVETTQISPGRGHRTGSIGFR